MSNIETVMVKKELKGEELTKAIYKLGNKLFKYFNNEEDLAEKTYAQNELRREMISTNVTGLLCKYVSHGGFEILVGLAFNDKVYEFEGLTKEEVQQHLA